MDPTYKGLSVPQAHKRDVRSGPNFKLIILVSVGLLAIVTVLGLIFGGSSGNKYLGMQFTYRLEHLRTLAADGSNVADNDLKKLASEAHIIITGHLTTIKPLIPTVKSDKKLTALKTAEQDAAGDKTLSDAKLNGAYDTAYKQLFEQKLQETYALATELHDKTSSKKLRTALEQLQTDLNSYYLRSLAIQL